MPIPSLSVNLSLKLGLIKARFTFADGYVTHSRKRKPSEAMLAAHGRLVGTVYVDQPAIFHSQSLVTE
jgi:hypothetical protein